MSLLHWSAAVLKASRRYQRKWISFLLPRNSNGCECLGPTRQSVTPSPQGRGGVRGKCTQYSHASQFLRFVSPPHEPKLSQCSRSNQTTSVPKGGLGGTGHWPVLAGDPPDSRARSKVRDRRTFRAQDSAASCRRGRPSWPCHPEQRHPLWQVHGFKARTAVRRIPL